MTRTLLQQALDAMKDLEWVEYEDPDQGNQVFCPDCRNAKQYGHFDDCDLNAAIAALQAALDAPEPEPEPVAWRLGTRVYNSLKDAEWDWRHDETFDNTGYVPEPLFAAAGAAPFAPDWANYRQGKIDGAAEAAGAAPVPGVAEIHRAYADLAFDALLKPKDTYYRSLKLMMDKALLAASKEPS